jgi:hypothetical protein
MFVFVVGKTVELRVIDDLQLNQAHEHDGGPEEREPREAAHAGHRELEIGRLIVAVIHGEILINAY